MHWPTDYFILPRRKNQISTLTESTILYWRWLMAYFLDDSGGVTQINTQLCSQATHQGMVRGRFMKEIGLSNKSHGPWDGLHTGVHVMTRWPIPTLGPCRSRTVEFQASFLLLTALRDLIPGPGLFFARVSDSKDSLEEAIFRLNLS